MYNRYRYSAAACRITAVRFVLYHLGTIIIIIITGWIKNA